MVFLCVPITAAAISEAVLEEFDDGLALGNRDARHIQDGWIAVLWEHDEVAA